MDTSPRHIEVLADKRGVLRNMIADLLFIVLSKFRNDGRVHTVKTATELCIFKDHCFQRCIAGTLSDPKKGTVHAAGTIEPCCRGIADCLVEVIVAMKFNEFARHPCMNHQTVDDTRNRPRDHRSGIVDAISHRIADTDLNRNPVLSHQIHQLQAKRYHKSINVRSGDIFQVAPWTDPDFQAVPDNGKIMPQRLSSCHFQLIENMIIRTAYKNSCLLETDLFDKLKVLFACADPACHFRKLIALL